MMNNSYLSYFRTRNPFKFFSDIFRNYKKSSEDYPGKEKIKRNQSESAVAQQKLMHNNGLGRKPKSEVNLCDKPVDQWNNSKFENGSSQESLKMTWSNSKFGKTSSNISLKKTKCLLDLNVKDDGKQVPDGSYESNDRLDSPKIPLKRAYPWQNFNLSNIRGTSREEEVKPVNNLTREFFRKSILRKQMMKSSRESPVKEVKFNKMASMMVYPKNSYNIMRHPRVNLGTNNHSVDKSGVIIKKKKVKALPVLSGSKLSHIRLGYNRPIYYRKHLRNRVKECLPLEQGNFWYLNSKKQRIF